MMVMIIISSPIDYRSHELLISKLEDAYGFDKSSLKP